MDASDPLAFDGGIATWRPRATLSLEHVVRLVRTTIDASRQRGVRLLLADLTGLDGFESPSLPERFQFSRQWAEAAGGALRVAFVVKLEMIDSQKFGVVVGKNFGADMNVFADANEALAWLRGG